MRLSSHSTLVGTEAGPEADVSPSEEVGERADCSLLLTQLCLSADCSPGAGGGVSPIQVQVWGGEPSYFPS